LRMFYALVPNLNYVSLRPACDMYERIDFDVNFGREPRRRKMNPVCKEAKEA